MNGETVGYVTKYITKEYEGDKEYKPKVFASKGIGSGYVERGK